MKKTNINIAHINGDSLGHRNHSDFLLSFSSGFKASNAYSPPPFKLNIKNKFFLQHPNPHPKRKKFQLTKTPNFNFNNPNNFETNPTIYKTPSYADNNTTNPTLNNNKNYEELLKEKDNQIIMLQKRLLYLQTVISNLKQDHERNSFNSSTIHYLDSYKDSQYKNNRKSRMEGNLSSSINMPSVDEQKQMASFKSSPNSPRSQSRKIKKAFSLGQDIIHAEPNLKGKCQELKNRTNKLLNRYYQSLSNATNKK